MFYFEGHNSDLRLDQEGYKRMLKEISHRGPDDSDTWIDENLRAALIHTRLAIRDLSNSGRQPMSSSSGRFVITYNGEAYGDYLQNLISYENRLKLRGTSDTELLLEAFSLKKVKEFLEELNGMFAFGVLDRQEQKLILARDRFGEKPLYFHQNKNRLIFSSELKSLLAFGDFTPVLDRNAAASFMRHNYVPAPNTIIKDVMKLLPGTFLEVSKDGTLKSEVFFDAKNSFINGLAISRNPNIDNLEQVLEESVRDRLVSDVPVGCLLSGGIDSSLVAAFMQRLSSRAIETFTIGFERKEFDEAPFARQVASRLGTNHNELYVTERNALEIVPQISGIFTEPFADSSQIPTILVSRFARTKVPVVLTGDGGDELFAGYRRYENAELLGKLVSNPTLKRVLSTITSDPLVDIIRRIPQGLLYRITGVDSVHSKIARYKKSFLESPPSEVYRKMVSHWPDPSEVINQSSEYIHYAWEEDFTNGIQDPVTLMRLIDIYTYLPDDILVKVDRAAMSVGLESRAPFLDPRVFELSSQMPYGTLIRDNQLKFPLKELAYKLIGKDIMDRRKMGFGVPIGEWLRGPLKEWAQGILNAENKGELFNEQILEYYWERHLNGEDWGYWIWNYLMLKSWIVNNPEIKV